MTASPSPAPARSRVPLARLVVRGTLSLGLALAAAACIVRGLGRLFSGGASYGGVSSALGYFVVGVLLLLAAGEAYPRSHPTPVTESGERG